MRLSDRDIERYLAEGKIGITPAPDADMISGVSVDIRLGNKFRVFQAHAAPYIDLSGPRAQVDAALNSVMSDEIFISERDSQPFKIRYGISSDRDEAIVFEAVGVDGKRMVGFFTPRELDPADYDAYWTGKKKGDSFEASR